MLEVTKTTVVGGKAVISEGVVSQLPQPTRYWGQDQYQTGVSVVNNLSEDLTQVYIATGETFQDALAGAALAGRSGSPILFS